MAMGRLNTFADDDVPQEMIQNISNVIELPVIKKLSDYSKDEIENFPQIAEENSEARLYDADVQARYNHVMTMLDRAGPEGSLQEQEFMKDLFNSSENLLRRPNDLKVPIRYSVKFGDKSLRCHGAKIWNSLPNEIHSISSFTHF